MENNTVFVISTGIANIASIMAGLRRAGATPEPTLDPDIVANADRVVLPGVGAFGAGMARLRRAELVEPLIQRINADRPTLAICLGLQLLCRESEETPDTCGLGIIDTVVQRFPNTLRVPQIGWNHITPPSEDETILQSGHAYFANSFRIQDGPSDWIAAKAEYGSPFVAAIQRGRILGCQFHPELSGAYGIALLQRWLGDETLQGDEAC